MDGLHYHLSPASSFLQRIAFALFVLWFSPDPLFSIDTLHLQAGFTSAKGEDFAHVFMEEKHELDFEKIRRLPDYAFHPLAETGVSFPPSQEVYWLKFYLKNDTPTPREFLLELHNPRINRLQFFKVAGKGTVIQSSLMGDDFPFRQRDIYHRNFLYPIALQAGERATVFLFADKYSENMLLRLSLSDRAFFDEHDRHESFLLAAYAGVLLCISVFTIVVAALVRSRVFVFLALYCTLVTVELVHWMGFGFKYLWPNWPYFNSIGGYLLIIAICVVMLGLTRAYLDTRRILPKADRWLRVLQWPLLAFVPYLVFYREFSHSIGSWMVNFGHVVELTFVFSVLVVTLLAYWKTGERGHLLFLAGFLFALLANFIYLMETFGAVDSNFITQYAILFGFLVDMVVLMYILGLQMKRTYTENLHLIDSLGRLKVEAAGALLSGQREERQRLSMELHDGVSLRLAIIRMRFSKLKNELKGSIIEAEAVDLLVELGQASSEIRSFTHDLAPVDFEETSLHDALEDLVYAVEAGAENLQVSLWCELGESELKGFPAHAVYQSAKELLANVLKHAEAKQVKLEFYLEDNHYVLRVSDNGKGFSEAQKEEGIGLKNLRARATLLNGKVEVESTAAGTVVSLVFPE